MHDSSTTQTPPLSIPFFFFFHLVSPSSMDSLDFNIHRLRLVQRVLRFDWNGTSTTWSVMAPQFIKSNHQLTGFPCSSPAGKTPNSGASSITPAGGHISTAPGGAYSFAEPGPAVNTASSLTPVSQGGPTTSTYIAQPGPPMYRPAREPRRSHNSLTRRLLWSQRRLRPFSARSRLRPFSARNHLCPFSVRSCLRPFSARSCLRPFSAWHRLRPFSARSRLRPSSARSRLSPSSAWSRLRSFSARSRLRLFSARDRLRPFFWGSGKH